MNLRQAIKLSSVSVMLFLVFSGCARFVLVRSDLVEPKAANEAEVTGTPEFLAAVPKLRRVALRAPDTCASLGAAERTGVAQKTGTVVATECGVEMAELERALTQAGYIVSSWRALANDMTSHQVTALEAAKKLGAEVLFQVNALERVNTPRGEGGRWNRTFYRSNSCGAPLGHAALDERDVMSLRANATYRESTILQDKKLLGATLNVNAVMVETGQTIWFYQWTKFDSSRPEISVQVLSQLTDNRIRRWSVVSPECSMSYATSSASASSTEFSATGITAGSETEVKNLYFKLMRAVVGDFVNRFSRSPGAIPGAGIRTN